MSKLPPIPRDTPDTLRAWLEEAARRIADLEARLEALEP